MIVAELTDEDSPDSSHYTLPFFNIKKLRLPIAMELVRGLDDPDISEFTKRVAFDLLMRVELVTKESNTY